MKNRENRDRGLDELVQQINESLKRDRNGEFRWYKVIATITVYMRVLAPDKETAKEIAFEELTNEIQSDGVQIHNVVHKIEVLENGED